MLEIVVEHRKTNKREEQVIQTDIDYQRFSIRKIEKVIVRQIHSAEDKFVEFELSHFKWHHCSKPEQAKITKFIRCLEVFLVREGETSA